ncbi:hypothetical protein IFT44_01000 [Pseudomonas sp. CFBP 13710]|nr:hypothetical protein [Pseudomonas sp. CFBP 13710]
MYEMDLEGEKRLDSLPNHLVGFIAANKSSAVELKDIADHWVKHGHDVPPSLTVFDPKAGPESLNNWLISQLVRYQISTSRRNVTLMRELSKIRISHEETLESYRALERYAEANFDLHRTESLLIEPCSRVILLDGDKSTAVQLMPTVSVGISDIGVHVSAISTDADGYLHVKLNTVESSEQVGSWKIPFQNLSLNWLRLALPQSLGVDEQSIYITIRWCGTGSVSISAGVPHPDPRWCVQLNGEAENRTLAMKAWRSLPQTRPTAASMSSPIDGLQDKRWLVAEDIMRGVANLSNSRDHVKYLEEPKAILVHPINQTPVLGKLAQAAPVGAKHIWADIQSANKEAAPIEYALAISVPDPETLDEKGVQFKPGFISEWITVEGGAQSELHLFLPEPLIGTGDIYLATRLKPGYSNEKCWAYFKKIRATA